MKKVFKLFLFFTGLLFLWGCYPQGPESYEELDVVLTRHNEDYDFVSQNTYSLPDKIVKITGNLTEDGDPVFIPDVTAKKILDRIESNMASLGWQKVAVSANPDMLLLPASWETTTIYYWYDYWYWWYGGYYPGWGWGGYYPGYYPPVYWDSYTTGTLVMSLIDKDILGANGNPVTQWTGAINGILTYSYDATRMNTAIDKAFSISPYLKTN
jgi:hypothetical protein